MYHMNTNEAATITPKLDRIEDGFARVTDAATGKVIGYVSRAKSGSGRTSVRWTARRTNTPNPLVLGYGDTRAEAVAVVVKNAERFAPKPKPTSEPAAPALTREFNSFFGPMA